MHQEKTIQFRKGSVMAGLVNSGTSADFGCGNQLGMAGFPQLGNFPQMGFIPKQRGMGGPIDDFFKKVVTGIKTQAGTIVDKLSGQAIYEIKDALGNVLVSVLDTPENRVRAQQIAQEKVAAESASWLIKYQTPIMVGAGTIVLLLVVNILMKARK